MGTALILIDAQRNMLEGDCPVVGVHQVRPALEGLLTHARAAGSVVVHVQNDGPPGYPDEPDSPGWQLVFAPAGDELVVRKERADTFADNPDLAPTLRERGVERLVIAGMQSEYCVRETGVGALGLGFGVVLPIGAHATYDNGASSAYDLAEKVEKDLAEAGANVLPLADVTFR
jgi:nicotinamidase-related amidase